MAQPSVHGRFIWQELITADTAAAAAFYAKVVGWRTQSLPNPHSDYQMFAAASGPVAGLMSLPEDVRASGTRPHWLPYIGTDDVDATVEAAGRLGGKTLRAATDIENVGRYAMLADPQGAAFGIFKPLPSEAAPSRSQPQSGEFAWRELASSDLEAAFKFYRELFGWQSLRRTDMGAAGVYLVFGRDGAQLGGIYKPASASTPHWLSYVEVADVDAVVGPARDAGGRVVTGPLDVPGGGRIVQLVDSGGVMFAVHAATKATTGVKTSSRKAPTKLVSSVPAKPAAVPAARKAVTRRAVVKKAVAKKPVTKVKAKAKAKTKARKVTRKSARKPVRTASRRSHPSARRKAVRSTRAKNTAAARRPAKRARRAVRKPARRKK